MQITVTNLGAIRQAQFELGDMTIICGGTTPERPTPPMRCLAFSLSGGTLKVPVAAEVIEALLKDGELS